MSRHPLHLCLVSRQATPNLVPACDPEFRPREAILLTSPDMRREAGWLDEVLRGRQVATTPWPIDNPFDQDHVRMRIEKLLAERQGQGIALNATGGTKIMALAAHGLFVERGLPVFYVHPGRDQVLWLQPPGPAVDIADRVGLGEYLQAHGYRSGPLQKLAFGPATLELTRVLVEENARFQGAIATLNYLAGSAQGKPHLRSTSLDERQWQDPALAELAELFATRGLFRREQNRLAFADETSRFFVNGGWLERHIFETLLELRQELGIQDLAAGIEVTTPGGSRNELDVAFLRGNRLHLVECKTRNLISRDGNDPATQALYKLDSLTELGGLNTRCLLVSFRQLPAHDRQRARDLGIEVIEGSGLGSLASRLRKWIDGRRR